MKFQPITEEEAEAQAGGIWPAGEYDFEVREATEKESKSGNDMTELELWIYNKEGDRRLVFDYLVATEKSAWKLRHFAASCGLLPQYEKGILMANEMVGRTGKCEIGIRKQEGYPDKNTVRSYVKSAASAQGIDYAKASRDFEKQRAPSRVKSPAGDIEDEVPF